MESKKMNPNYDIARRAMKAALEAEDRSSGSIKKLSTVVAGIIVAEFASIGTDSEEYLRSPWIDPEGKEWRSSIATSRAHGYASAILHFGLLRQYGERKTHKGVRRLELLVRRGKAKAKKATTPLALPRSRSVRFRELLKVHEKATTAVVTPPGPAKPIQLSLTRSSDIERAAREIILGSVRSVHATAANTIDRDGVAILSGFDFSFAFDSLYSWAMVENNRRSIEDVLATIDGILIRLGIDRVEFEYAGAPSDLPEGIADGFAYTVSDLREKVRAHLGIPAHQPGLLSRLLG